MHEETYIVGTDEAVRNFSRKEHQFDAGYDIAAAEDLTIEPYAFVKAKTGIKIDIPCNTALWLKSRSSTFAKGLLIDGIVDPDFGGEVFIPIWNLSPNVVEIKKGEYFCQGLLIKVRKQRLQKVENLPFRKCRHYKGNSRKLEDLNQKLEEKIRERIALEHSSRIRQERVNDRKRESIDALNAKIMEIEKEKLQFFESKEEQIAALQEYYAKKQYEEELEELEREMDKIDSSSTEEDVELKIELNAENSDTQRYI